MNINIGDCIYTPRFCTVKISDKFSSVEDMCKAGYTETTHYNKDNNVIYGKSIGVNRMVFAVANINNTI